MCPRLGDRLGHSGPLPIEPQAQTERTPRILNLGIWGDLEGGVLGPLDHRSRVGPPLEAAGGLVQRYEYQLVRSRFNRRKDALRLGRSLTRTEDTRPVILDGPCVLDSAVDSGAAGFVDRLRRSG